MTEKIVNLLKKLVSIKSNYPYEKTIGDFIYSYLITKDLIIEKFNIGDKNLIRNNLLISKKQSRFSQKKILLYGHLDTVDITEGWLTDHFKLVIKKNRAYGLGAYDMKAGLAIIIQLLLLKEDLPVKAIFSVDEENICTGIHSLKNHSFFKDVAFALVPEPDFGYGQNSVCLGKTGRSVIQVIFKGDTAHMFFAQKAVNAIRQAEIFDYYAEKLIKLKQNKAFQQATVVPRMFQSEAIGFSVPGSALIEYDILLVPPETGKEVLAKFKNLANKLVKDKKINYQPLVRLRKRVTPYLEPYQINKQNNYLKFIARGIKEVTSKQISYRTENSVADENVLVNVHKIPSFTLGPGGENAHGANEYVNLDSMKKTYDIYLAIIKEYIKSLS